jgi:Rsm1-like
LVEWFTEVLHDGGSGKASQDPTTTAVNNEAQNQSNEGDAPTKANISALLLALCGWSGEKVADVPIATCQKCFTRLGLWMYQPKPDSAEDIMTLDPVSLHRSYCPWQDPVSMSALGSLEGMAGWQVLADGVAGQIERAKRQKRKTSFGTEDDVDSIVTSRASKDELDSEDRARESKLARLKRAFAVKKGKKA